MQCPYCNYKESKVVDSRHTDSKSIRRRRECESCKKRFTTYEIIETTPVMVVKKDNSRELFNREKIKRGIIKSCEKRPVSIEQIESIISYVENEINKNYISEINTDKILLRCGREAAGHPNQKFRQSDGFSDRASASGIPAGPSETGADSWHF